MTRVFLAALAATLLLSNLALAEGTDELMPSVGDSGRLGLVDAGGIFFFDVLDPATEVICVVGADAAGDPVTYEVRAPDDTVIATAQVSDGDCVSLAGNPAGAYRLANFSRAFTSTQRWDISVCDTSAGTCDASVANPAHLDGRVFAYRWVFNSTSTQSAPRAVQSSVYARVPIGRFGQGVVELQLGGVHGLARWELLANRSGIRGVNPSRSTREGREVDTEYPIYFNLPDPLVEAYGVPSPRITDFMFVASGEGERCGAIEAGRNEAVFSFDANMPGQVRVICDVDEDGVFDSAGATDLVVGAEAAVGDNEVRWDGTGTTGDVPAGEYDCLVELNAGEFHYVAEDIEVAYPGLRMFQVSPTLERTPLRMWWNDLGVVPADPIEMPNGDLPQTSSPEGGLDSGAYADAAAAHGINNVGNARGWGAFTTSGSLTGSRGDGNLIDTWTGLETVRSGTVRVRVIGRAADCDGLGGTDFEEICITGTNPCACDADAECDDGVECTFDSCNGVECVAESIPRGGECAGGRCSGGDEPFCAMCLDGSDCPDGTECVGNRCVGDDDDMDTIANLVECPGLREGATCPDTDGDGMVDYQDPDDDDDGLLTRDEVADGMSFGNDVDGDGIINWHDTDSDDDGLSDGEEGREDTDGNGRPEYLDPRDPNAMMPPISPPVDPPAGGLTGGALCATGQGGSAPWSLALLMAALLWRRRR